MKVLIKTAVAGADQAGAYAYKKGKVYDIEKSRAAELIKAGHGESNERSKKAEKDED